MTASNHIRQKVPAWQLWKKFRPQKDVGMSDAEAREAGILPPLGWREVRYSMQERLRSTMCWGRAAAMLAAELGRGTQDCGFTRGRRVCLALLGALGLELSVAGQDRTPPPDQGALFMWNQTSHLDHLVLGAIADRPYRSLYNIELARVPGYGKWLRKEGHYLVDRYDEEQWQRSIAQAAGDVREKGVSILVSPEGTRSWDGKLLPMKRGAFILAIEAAAPIVPIVIGGGHEALPRGSSVLRPGRISVKFLDPIDPRAFTQETRKELKALVARSLRGGD